MNNNFSKFSEVLKYIIENSGKEILKNQKKTNGFISDLAPGSKFQKEKKLLNDAYSCNAVNILLDADTSVDRHKKAVDSAKDKLMDSMALSESGSDLILKEICDALGWNTQQLFNSSSSQEKVQPAIPKENKNVSLNKEYYNQPIITEPVNANKPVVYSKQTPITSNVQTAKKKSPFGALLKVAAVIIVVCVIYNLGKNDGSSDTVIIDETQAAVSETTFSEKYSETTAAAANTEPVTATEPANTEAVTIAGSEQAYNENAAEAAFIAPDPIFEMTSEITISETTMSVTTTQEVTTADPRAGKYVVTDIARFECSKEDIKYDKFMTYDSNENAVYYVADNADIHKYNLSDKSDNIILSLKDIEDKLTGDSSNGNSLINKDNVFYEFGADGVVFNKYSGKVYAIVYGINSYKYSFIYDIENDNIIEYKVHNIPTLSFINEDEFWIPLSGYCNLSNGDYNYVNSLSSRNFYRIVDINDNYYAVMSDGNVRKFSNVYMAKSDELFSLKMSGADEKDNTLYYKDWENNVYKIDLDNLTEEIYISVDDIFQNGKQFLGSGQCSGFCITNDGGFITYDKSDNKLKYVSMNQ